MLPSVAAFGFAWPTGLIGWPVRHGVDPLLIGSVLYRVSPPVSLFKRASLSPRLVPSTTMASADFPPPEGGGISPGKSTLLRRTAAAFTSRGIPDVFGVLCPLDAPCRRCRAAPALRAACRLAVSASLRLYTVLVHRLATFS